MEEQLNAINALLMHGLTTPWSEPIKLRSFQESAFVADVAWQNRKIYKMLNRISRRLLRAYISDLKNYKPNSSTLTALSAVLRCKDFFYNETKVALECIREFRKYIFKGNLIKAIFGYDRDDD